LNEDFLYEARDIDPLELMYERATYQAELYKKKEVEEKAHMMGVGLAA